MEVVTADKSTHIAVVLFISALCLSCKYSKQKPESSVATSNADCDTIASRSSTLELIKLYRHLARLICFTLPFIDTISPEPDTQVLGQHLSLRLRRHRGHLTGEPVNHVHRRSLDESSAQGYRICAQKTTKNIKGKIAKLRFFSHESFLSFLLIF